MMKQFFGKGGHYTDRTRDEKGNFHPAIAAKIASQTIKSRSRRGRNLPFLPRFPVVIRGDSVTFSRKVFNLMHPHPQHRTHAFTLVELLTVIAIIAILMGLLFPAINGVKDQARKAEAKTACTNIVTALKAYNTEYGKYPATSSSTTAPTGDVIVGDTVGGATTGNEFLFNILRNIGTNAATPNPGNPRRISFFEGKAATATPPKGGFSNGAFYDPWGAQYCVAIDVNYDNLLDTLPYTDFKTTTTYQQTGVGAFSLGKDGKLGLNGKYKDGSNTSDDIISWQ